MDQASLRSGTVPVSAIDLAAWFRDRDPLVGRASTLFEVVELACSELVMSERGRAESFATFRAPLDAIQRQSVVSLVDLTLHREALVNHLRARRGGSVAVSVAELASRLADACRWCDPSSSFGADILGETFGVARSAAGRVVAGPNHARLAPFSAVVFGDHTMHDLLSLDTDDASELMEGAQAFIDQVRRAHAAPYWTIVQNGGRRSAGSVDHAHLQVLGRADHHFGEPARVAALAPARYWDMAAEVHQEIGLGVDVGSRGRAFATLVPVKEGDFTVLTRGSLVDGVRAVWPLVQALVASGTSSWSLAAMPNPRQFGADIEPYRSWPDVVWRFVDRGRLGNPVSDMGAMELFGSAAVATDPYVVADRLRSAFEPAAVR